MSTQKPVFRWNGFVFFRMADQYGSVNCALCGETDGICQGEKFPAWNLSGCKWTQISICSGFIGWANEKRDTAAPRPWFRFRLLGSKKDRHWTPETSGYLPGQRWISALYAQAQQDLKIEGCLMKAAGGNEDSVYEGACRQMDGGLFDVSFCREWGAVRILAKQYPLWMGKRKVILCLGLSDGASRNSL